MSAPERIRETHARWNAKGCETADQILKHGLFAAIEMGDARDIDP